jgi:predicted flap endonuclease-1-like 5' DNA nuclease
MSEREGSLSCAQGCWAMALGAGVIALALLMVLGDWRLIQALFALVVITIILGALLQWLVCKHMSAPGEPPVRKPVENPVPSSKQSAAAAAAAARAGAEPVPATPAQAAAIAARGGVKPSKPLAGEAELASRKGSWKYEGGANKAEAAPAPVADAPQQLSAPRDGNADDLKMIKGVGPKLEELLHKMGFFHFDQIASWTDKEVAWVDENLEGFKGRVSRDNWVEQAKTLAAGGSTEFSDKVKKGDVY